MRFFLASMFGMLVHSLPSLHGALGDLDATFGSSGKVITNIGGESARASAVAVQADGKIVLVGSAENDGLVVRYTKAGALDAGFGTSGKVKVSGAGGFNCVAVQSDGKIVLAGVDGSGGSVVKLMSDGSLDTTFSGNGIATVTGIVPVALAVQSDGKIVCVGSAGLDAELRWQIGVARFQTNGALDTTFAGNGKRIMNLDDGPIGNETPESYAGGLAIQSDGKIVVGGSFSSRAAVARLTSAGSLDTSFGGNGKMNLQLGPGSSRTRSLAIQNDDRILLGGTQFNVQGINWDQDVFLMRVTSSGAADSTLGGSGYVVTALPASDPLWGGLEETLAVFALPDGSSLVAVNHMGDSSGATNPKAALIRYSASGSVISQRSTTVDGYLSGAARQNDGKVVMVGQDYSDENSSSKVLRRFAMLGG
ncbi:MAG: hypothetical protein IAE77_00215 [Prosthecobacter sp.]|nr:hypothetical protein [Prosthecobacter sp.]